MSETPQPRALLASATTLSCSDTVAPSIPTGLTATAAGCSQVNLSWTASSDTGGSGLAGYRVYRNGVQIATTSVASYSSTGLAGSTGYSFTVAAYDNAGNASTQSTSVSATTPICPDTTAPSMPTGLTASPTSCSQINLSWTASTDTGGSGLAGYKVFRNGVQIATTNLTSYNNTSLVGSTGYSFTVAAYDNAGNASTQSTSASATTPICPDTTAPSMPTGLTASAASCSQINLSWTASTDTGGSGLAGYNVYRNGVQIATTNLTSYNNTGLAGSTSYTFTVAAYDNAGNTSGQSTSDSGTTSACADTTAPSMPTGLTASAFSCSQINLSWNASSDTGGSGLAGYKVFRNGVQIATTNLTSYNNTSLVGSTGYSFTVAAYDNAGNASTQSTSASATTPICPDTTAPSMPTGLTASAASCSQINLSWTASTDTGGSGLAGYNVYRNGVQIATTNLTSYNNTGLAGSTSYSFTVAAYDNAGNASTQSTSASATTPICPDTTAPSMPTGLTASAASCSQINLSWTASTDTGGSGLAGYKVYRNGVQIATTNLTSYNNTGLAGSASYSFTVAAYDNAGNASTQSTSASTTTPICPDTTAPSMPTGLTASPTSCSQINLSWTASTDTGGSGLAGYNVYRNGVQIATTNLTSYNSTGLAGSSSYSFTVAAYDNAGNASTQSTSASATTPICPDTTAPSMPTGLTASAASCSQINLSWTASTDAGGSGLAGYKVFRNGVQIATTNLTSYNNTSLAGSTSYTFTVAAYDNAGNTSGQSTSDSATTSACADTTAPSIPTGLTASVVDCSQINLSWTASTDTGGSGLSGYRVYRNGVQIATTNLVSYSSTGLTGATSYAFAVAAYDNAGNTSAPSTAASATTPTCLANLPPIANAGLDQTTSMGTVVTFNGSGSSDSDGTITAYAWDFGDGASGTGSIVNHAYTTSGTKTVTLTVTDNSGARTSDVAFVTVLAQTSGQYLWSKGFGGSSLGDSVIVNAVAADANGNVVITGQLQGRADFGGALLTSAGGSDVFIAKFSSSGALLWSKRFGATSTDTGYGIGVDTSGNVLVIGIFQGTVDFGGGSLISAGGSDIFLAKYSSSGAHLWSKRFGGTGNDMGFGIAVAGNGDVAVTGSFGNFGSAVDFGGGPLTSAGGPDIFVAKYSTDGVHLWSRGMGGTGQDVGQSVGVDGGGNVVVTGYFQGTVNFGSGSLTSAGGTDIFLMKYSASGAPVWSKRFGGVSDDRGVAVAVSGTGDVVATGYWGATADFGGGPVVNTGGADIFLAKYSSTGAYAWSKVWGTSYGYGDVPHGVALDASGNIALTGSLLGPLDFGGGPLAESGSYDIFAAKFSASGAHLWSKRFGVLYDDSGDAIAMDTGGNVIVVGDFNAGVDFGGGELLSPGGESGFLARFGP
jgi:chitodextrinase